jgi:hypothetical protein
MKLATTLTVRALALAIAPARSQDLTVRSNGDDIIVPHERRASEISGWRATRPAKLSSRHRMMPTS